MKRGRNLKLRLFLVLLLTFAIVQTPFALINAPRFQQWFLKTYKPFSPWMVTFDSLKLHPWRLNVAISNLKFSHPNGHQVVFESIQIKAKILRLLRAQLAVRSLEVQSPTITISKSLIPEKKTPKKRFKIRTLLLLQNLMIDKGSIQDLKLNLPEGRYGAIESFNLSLKPALLGGTNLGLDFRDVAFQNKLGKKSSTQNLRLSVTTDFTNWSKTFPYIDDVDGNLYLKETSVGRLHLKGVEAKVRFDKGKLTSKKFAIQVGEDFLFGKLESELQSQKYSLSLDIPKPIRLPEIGSEMRTFNTAGQLTAALNLEGQGFDIKTSKARGILKATHIFENLEDHPVEVASQFDLEKGSLLLKEAKVTTDNASIEVAGTIDLTPPLLRLTMKAKEFPIERFFDKFLDKNLHPIHGKGNVDATLNGLGKSIHLQLTGEAIEGGYGILQAEKATVTLDITYNRLRLDGKILTGGKTTGEAQFMIDYGPKVPGKARSKKISLLAKLNGQPLESTLPGFHLKGEADGELKLSGSPQNIQGTGVLNAIQGSFFDEGFESIRTRFSLTNKKLVVDKAELQFSNLSTSFIKPLTFDFIPGGFKLSGQPFAGFSVDANFQNETKRWQINRLAIQDPSNTSLKAQVSGSYSPTNLDLKGQGSIELSNLKFLGKYIRDASGPLQFQLAVRGSPPNLQINGKIQFDESMLSLRALPFSAEELKGTLNFQGNRIQTDNLTGTLGTGSFHLKGWMTHAQGKPSGFDLKLAGNQLYYRNEKGDFRMEYDADLAFKGAAQNPELTGSLTILDGRYTKDFNIIEEIKEMPRAVKEFQKAALEATPIRLNLVIRNLGDLLIDNNVGRIELAANLKVQGTRMAPRFQGSVDVTEGIIHYLGLDFDITRGFLEFRDLYAFPYLEVDAEKDVADTHIRVRLHGRTNNLAIDLAGTSAREGALEKKDVLSLILFGVTTSERLQQTSLFHQEFGPELVAEQITHALQRPFARATRLDILRLEAKPTQEGRVRQFHVGKRLSDRLSLEFASEIDREQALQTFRLEYWLTDFLIFKGARTTDESYQLNLGLRFKSR